MLAIGEALIDLTSSGDGGYLALPGGAPLNALGMLSRLGRKTAFIGKVGADAFGRKIRDALLRIGIDETFLSVDPIHPTTLAVVSTDKKGERSFAFYREDGADRFLCPADVDADLIKRARAFHFGSLSLTHPENRLATEKALSAAKSAALVISFDPNLRPLLWRDLSDAGRAIDFGMQNADVVKISLDEARFLLRNDALSLSASAASLFSRYPGIRLLSVTDGQNGSLAAMPGVAPVFTPAFSPEKAIDTTGCGDCFCACMLDAFLSSENGMTSRDDLTKAAALAAAAAGLLSRRKGALAGMPTKEEVEAVENARA